MNTRNTSPLSFTEPFNASAVQRAARLVIRLAFPSSPRRERDLRTEDCRLGGRRIVCRKFLKINFKLS